MEGRDPARMFSLSAPNMTLAAECLLQSFLSMPILGGFLDSPVSAALKSTSVQLGGPKNGSPRSLFNGTFTSMAAFQVVGDDPAGRTLAP